MALSQRAVLQVEAILQGKTAQFEQSMNRATKAVNGFGTRGKATAQAFEAAFTRAASGVASRIDAAVMRWGRRLVFGGGAAVTAFTVKAVKDFATFDKGMREVNTLLKLSESEFQKLALEVRDVAKTYGIDLTDAVKAYYQAASAGIARDDITRFIVTAAKASKAGVATLGDSVEVLISVINAYRNYGYSAADAERVADMLFATVKGGLTTYTQLAQSFSQVASVAASANIPVEQVTGALTTLTRMKTPTAEAMTQIRAAIQSLINPSDLLKVQLDRLYRETGDPAFASGANLLKLKGLQGAMQALAQTEQVRTLRAESSTVAMQRQYATIARLRAEHERLQTAALKSGETTQQRRQRIEQIAQAIQNNMASVDIAMKRVQAGTRDGSEAIAKMLGSVEAFQLFVKTTGPNAQSALADVQAAKDSAGSMREAHAEMVKAAGRDFGILWANMRDLGIEVGKTLLPLLNQELIPALKKVVDWLQNWARTRGPEQMARGLEGAGKVAGFAADYGPTLLATYLFGKLGGGKLLKGAGRFLLPSLFGTGTAAALTTTATQTVAANLAGQAMAAGTVATLVKATPSLSYRLGSGIGAAIRLPSTIGRSLSGAITGAIVGKGAWAVAGKALGLAATGYLLFESGRIGWKIGTAIYKALPASIAGGEKWNRAQLQKAMGDLNTAYAPDREEQVREQMRLHNLSREAAEKKVDAALARQKAAREGRTTPTPGAPAAAAVPKPVSPLSREGFISAMGMTPEEYAAKQREKEFAAREMQRRASAQELVMAATRGVPTPTDELQRALRGALTAQSQPDIGAALRAIEERASRTLHAEAVRRVTTSGMPGPEQQASLGALAQAFEQTGRQTASEVNGLGAVFRAALRDEISKVVDAIYSQNPASNLSQQAQAIMP